MKTAHENKARLFDRLSGDSESRRQNDRGEQEEIATVVSVTDTEIRAGLDRFSGRQFVMLAPALFGERPITIGTRARVLAIRPEFFRRERTAGWRGVAVLDVEAQ